MSKTILQLLGFDLDNIPPGADWEFVWTFTDALESWRIFAYIGVVVALIYGVFFVYRREMDTCPRRWQFFLGVVRALVIVLLAVVLLGPAIKVSEKKTRQAVILVLVDESVSMLTQDRYLEDDAANRVATLLGKNVDTIRAQRPDRVAVMTQILNRDGGKLIRDLTRKGHVKFVYFSTRLGQPQVFPHFDPAEAEGQAKAKNGAEGKSADAPAEQDIPPFVFNPAGQGTNIARAVREAIKSTPGSPIAAVIVVTDGQQTVKDDEPLAAADFASEQNIPVFTLGVGDPSKKRNIRVAMAKANESVRRNNPFQVEAEIEAEGLDAMPVNVELVATKVAGAAGEVVLASRQINMPSSINAGEGDATSALQKLSFEYTPKTAGDYQFLVRVQKLARESDDDDNLSKPVAVKVRSDKSRVLLIAGGPTWEYRPLQALLTRTEDINVSIWLQTMDPNMRQEGKTVIDHLPLTPKEMFEYDAIIMLDPDPREFSEQWIETLRQFLAEHGGGLFFMPGPKYATAFLGGIRTAEFRDLMPVRFGDMGTLDVKALMATHNKEWPLAFVPANMDHPVMRFDTTNPAINEAVWSAMPGIYWSFPALDAKPATRVLLEHSDPALRTRDGRRPLMVTGFFGPGRIVYAGFNGSWRWRRLGNDAEYYEKFWMQTINYMVAGRDQRGSNRGYIDVAGEVFHKGDRITIDAKVYDPQFQPLDQQNIDATVKAGSITVPVKLERVPDAPGVFRGVIVANELGPHEISIPVTGVDPSKPPQPIVKAFTVDLPRVEMEYTRLNKALLVDIADRTRGQYFEVDEVAKLAAAVPNASQNIVVPRKPYELWSTDRLLYILVALLTIEWAVRKRFKLM